MTKLKSVLASLVLAALPLACAHAQSVGQLGPGQIWGNPTASQARARATNVGPQLDQAFGFTLGGVLERMSSGWQSVSATVTPQVYGASGSSQSTTGTISASSASLSLASALDFANGQGVRINHAGAAFAINQVTGASATFHGTAGSTTYTYTISTVDSAGGVGAAIAGFNCSSANATLSQSNYCQLGWTAPSGTAPFAYAIYRNSVLIGFTVQTSFLDPGLGSYGFAPPWIPTTPPGSSLADWLVTTVSSGGGTTSLTLAASAITAVSSGNVYHDDTAALQSWVNAVVSAHSVGRLPAGQYRTTSSITESGVGRFRLTGDGAIGTDNYYYALQGATFLNDASTKFGATILPSFANNAFSITTNDAHEIDHIGIVYSYPPPPQSGVTAIIDTGTGGNPYFSLSGNATNGSAIVTGLVSTTFVYVGAQCYIGSTAFTIASVDSSTQVHLSANFTGTTGAVTLVCGFEGTVSQTGSVTASSTTVTGLTGATNLSAGVIVTGPDIPFDTTIASVTNDSTIVLSQAATATNASESLSFALGIQTGASIHDNLLAQADRLLAISYSTEFNHYKNKFYNEQTYGVVLDLMFGNGDWSFGPNNIMVGGGIYTAAYDTLNNLSFVHILEQSGGGGRLIGNKFNTIGAAGANSNGYYVNPVRNYTSVEPPTITGNSFEGLNVGINFANSCSITSTCGVFQFSIAGNQMWNNFDISANSASQWIIGGTITGNILNVNGGTNSTDAILVGSDFKNVVISSNNFASTSGGAATAYSIGSGSSGVYAHGNHSDGIVTLGSGSTSLGSFSNCNSGSAITNTFVNKVEAYLFGGSGVTAMSRSGITIWGGGPTIAIQPTVSVMLMPGDNISVTTSSGTCPLVNFVSVDP